MAENANVDTVTDRVVGPLREFRLKQLEGLPQLQQAASAVQTAEYRMALASLDAAVEYLHEYTGFIRAEEFTMFIAVDGAIGVVDATRIMKAQHASITAMVNDLSQVVEAARTDSDVEAYARYLLPLLYGLYALIRAHSEAEDDAYLSVLDAVLSESQVGMITDNITRISKGGGKAPELPDRE
ncbi:MAG: hemerythrin domain-containing protein [Tepidiformaceae bacterium]